jgi:hypothetical protein
VKLVPVIKKEVKPRSKNVEKDAQPKPSVNIETKPSTNEPNLAPKVPKGNTTTAPIKKITMKKTNMKSIIPKPTQISENKSHANEPVKAIPHTIPVVNASVKTEVNELPKESKQGRDYVKLHTISEVRQESITDENIHNNRDVANNVDKHKAVIITNNGKNSKTLFSPNKINQSVNKISVDISKIKSKNKKFKII